MPKYCFIRHKECFDKFHVEAATEEEAKQIMEEWEDSCEEDHQDKITLICEDECIDNGYIDFEGLA